MEHLNIFELWKKHHHAPYHFDMKYDVWNRSMYYDVDSDGRVLFSALQEVVTDTGYIQYGKTAFGFDENGEISEDVQHSVIRCICFDDAVEGHRLLDRALHDLGTQHRIYAYFHYFGMSACARHGKLHEDAHHIHDLLMENGFQVEHENVYYARTLAQSDVTLVDVHIQWRNMSAGNCREFAAVINGSEVCWGQVHFLPQAEIAYLRWIYVDERMQHSGYGTKVLQGLFAELHRQGIRRFDTDTAVGNTVAQRFYEKNGFINRGITRSYHTK